MAKETKSTKEKETKKTTKTTTKPKTEKKEIVKEEKPVETIVYNDEKSKYDSYECDYDCDCECGNKCNCGCNSNRNFACLVVIIIILLVNTVLLSINLNGTTKTTKEEKTTETKQENTDYDVSKFKEVDVDGFVEKFKEDEYHLFYLGRPTCGYCVKFVPILNAVQDAYKFETVYFDISKYSSEEANKIIGLDETFFTGENTAYGYTPMMLITRNGEIVDNQIGYTDQATFEKLVSKYFDKK